MRYFVTGCAGFIGSNLTDRLLHLGHEVIGYDNLSTGHKRFLARALESPRFHFEKGDLLDADHLSNAMREAELVFHLAANADVRFGTEHPRKDLEQNTIATFNVLEAMRTNEVRQIAFTSTGSVYGEPEVFPTPEDAPFPIQTSLYGASKTAGEALIQAYCHGYGFQSSIFRLVSTLGERYNHGHVIDFYRSLRDNPQELHILGDGHQRKSYVYVQDCIDAMLTVIEKADSAINVFNIGSEEVCEVNDSIRWITQYMELSPKLAYSGGKRGWIGDSPLIRLDTRKLKELGWRPTLSIREGVLRTVEYLEANDWLLEAAR